MPVKTGSLGEPRAGVELSPGRHLAALGSVSNTPDWINIVRLGADPTGTLDSSAAIQAAFAFGKPVYAPAGTFKVGTAVVVPNFAFLIGDGADTTRFRATGNNYIFDLNPANRSRFTSFSFDSIPIQAAGGGFDFTNAGSHIYFDNVYCFGNLFRVFNIAPAASAGIFLFDSVRFMGDNTGIVFNIVPGAGALLTDIYVNRFVGTAFSAGGVTAWFNMSTSAAGSNLDSPNMNDIAFFRGLAGLTTSGIAKITGCKFSNFVVDTNLGGLQLDNVQDWTFLSGAVNSCGPNLPGVQIDGNANQVVFTGMTIQNCDATAVSIAAGARFIKIHGCKIINNNSGNHASGDGVSVAAGGSNFEVINNTIGNDTSGHTKTGVLVAAGASDGYIISENLLPGNETAAVTDGGAGVNKLVDRNITL